MCLFGQLTVQTAILEMRSLQSLMPLLQFKSAQLSPVTDYGRWLAVFRGGQWTRSQREKRAAHVLVQLLQVAIKSA